jgi:hypothetical protein
MRSLLTSPTVVLGTVVGAGAFLGGYLLTWILAGAEAASLSVGGALGGAVPDWKAVTWLFQDSHFVGTRSSAVVGPGGEPLAGAELVDTVRLLGVEFLYVVPLAVLLLGGAAIAWRSEARGPRAGMIAALSLTGGYLVLVVLSMMAAQQTGVGPSPLRALVIAGLVYPAAFGGIGGAVYGLYHRSAARSQAEPAPR